MMKILSSLRTKLVLLRLLPAVVLLGGGALAWHHFTTSPLSLPFLTGAVNECVARADRFAHVRSVRTYAIAYHSDSKSDLSRLFNAEKSAKPQVGQAAQLTLKATWEISTLERDGRLTMFGRLLKPEVTLEHNGQTDSAFNQQLVAELEKPFLVELTTQGEVIELNGQKDLSKIARNILRSLIADSQVVLPAQAQSTWTTRERDAHGFFEAGYRVITAVPGAEPATENSAVLKLSKNKIRYLELATNSKKRLRSTQPLEITTQLEPSMQAAIEFDCEKSALSSLNVSGALKTRVNRTEVGINQYQLSMKLLTISQLPAGVDLASLRKKQGLPGAATDTETYSLTSLESAEAMEQMIQKNELGDLTAEKLLALLKAAKASGDPTAIENLYLKFKALIYLQPEVCKTLASQMKQEDPKKSKAMLMLATALSTVGSTQAQDALVDVLSVRADDIASANILIPALGMTDKPTPKAEGTLRELIHSSNKEDVVSTAGLSLGAMAGNLAEQDPERSRAIVESVQKDYQNAETDQQKQYLLSVLGNAGSEQALPVISSALVL